MIKSFKLLHKVNFDCFFGDFYLFCCFVFVIYVNLCFLSKIRLYFILKICYYN